MSAQVSPGTSSGRQAAGSSNLLNALRDRYGDSSASTSALVLEGTLDPDEYIVGPGDVFAILIRGFEAASAPVSVSADGRLSLPDAGSVLVSDLTLTAVRDSVLHALRPAFGEASIELALIQPRSFIVHVTGAVATRGRHRIEPAGRVSTVLEQAFVDTSRVAVSNPKLLPSFRNITVVRRDGSELSVDLPRYFAGGTVAHNPYLRDGDIVVVRAYDPAFESLHIDGEVPFPGAYDARPDDTLRDVLAVAGVSSPPSVDLVVRLSRAHDDGSVTAESFTLMDVLEGTAGSVSVRARDHVSVETTSLPGGVASIDGWVFHPGTYPIQEGQSTVRDLVERAGGLREDALISGAFLVRNQPSMSDEIRPALASRATWMPDLSAMTGPDSLALMQRIRLTDLSIIGRLHFALAYRFQNRVSVDIPAMLEGRAEPVLLQDGDRLVIPRDLHSVYVFGQVIRPGLVTYQPGRSLADYVEMAGGAGPNASKPVLLRDQNGYLIDDPGAEVRSGDLVFLDRTLELPESMVGHEASILNRQAASAERQVDLLAEQNRRNARYQLASTFLAAVSSVGTIVALIVTLGRN